MRTMFAVLSAAILASGCGGGGADSPPSNVTLAAGQSITMSAGEVAEAPSGVVVNDHGSSVTINGHQNTVNVSAGAVVSVPAGATGAADNKIIAK